ncbi:ABC transporter permease [Rhodococcus sp. T2V]|uniref:ABC transporter permease n=1 Tax=Rhodococcus sp. T2V TaxID=3034164 RepID=UPI0023E2780B|nr:ABC transporter permease [Rhodococcus sp. T2V]MDF3310615.1 ABC transporter permease [Rhodococcus sp. T2V]
MTTSVEGAKAGPATQPEPPQPTAWAMIRNSTALRELSLLPAIFVVMVLGFILSPQFLTVNNLLNNVLVNSAVLGVVVVAESIILISGYFDLSLESIVGFIPMIAAWLSVPSALGGLGIELPAVATIAIGFVIAGLIGLLNGYLVAKLKLNAFMVTLAMLIFLRGITMGVSAGQTLSGLPTPLLWLGRTSILGISVQVWLFVLIFALAWLIMRNHPIGRRLYAMGGNEAAAEAAGIRTTRMTIAVFVTGALIAAFAGFMLTGRIASATSNQGDGLIFTVFAAAVIGGISLNGGKGSMIGAFLGVIILGMVDNILTLSRVPSYWVQATYGFIILAALVVNRFASQREHRRSV